MARTSHESLLISALESHAGIEAEFLEEREAINARFGCYKFINKERRASLRHDPTHPMYGRTPYDNLTLSIATFTRKGNHLAGEPPLVRGWSLAITHVPVAAITIRDIRPEGG